MACLRFIWIPVHAERYYVSVIVGYGSGRVKYAWGNEKRKKNMGLKKLTGGGGW